MGFSKSSSKTLQNCILRFFHSPNRSQYFWVWKKMPHRRILHKNMVYLTVYGLWARLKWDGSSGKKIFSDDPKKFQFFFKSCQELYSGSSHKISDRSAGGVGPLPPYSRLNVKFRPVYLGKIHDVFWIFCTFFVEIAALRQTLFLHVFR